MSSWSLLAWRRTHAGNRASQKMSVRPGPKTQALKSLLNLHPMGWYYLHQEVLAMTDYVDEHGLSEDSLRGSEQYAAPHGEGDARFSPESDHELDAADRWARTTPGRLETVEPRRDASVSRRVGSEVGHSVRPSRRPDPRRSRAAKKAAATRKRQAREQEGDESDEEKSETAPVPDGPSYTRPGFFDQ